MKESEEKLIKGIHEVLEMITETKTQEWLVQWPDDDELAGALDVVLGNLHHKLFHLLEFQNPENG